jgi:thioredoxin-like negative regulator of GroEL
MLNDDLFQQGMTAFEAGDYNSASLIFYRLTRYDPYNQDVWLWLAECVDDTENRRNFLTFALKLDPHSDAGRCAAARLRFVRLPACLRRCKPSIKWFRAVSGALEAFLHRLSARLRYSARH